ncbi:unnamed protein product [Urochloa humidicola]
MRLSRRRLYYKVKSRKCKRNSVNCRVVSSLISVKPEDKKVIEDLLLKKLTNGKGGRECSRSFGILLET